MRVVSEQLLILEADKEQEPTAEGADLEDTVCRERSVTVSATPVPDSESRRPMVFQGKQSYFKGEVKQQLQYNPEPKF